MTAARSTFSGAISFGASAFGLLMLSPIIVLLALAVLLGSGRPILFRQRRVGRNGRPFDLLKFRTMRNGLRGKPITAGGDGRVTRVGRVLRRYKLDELPQLWNVVRGEMSLVGPRPEIPELVDLDDPMWRAVLEVRPGITDLATLIYRNEEEILAAAENPERYYRAVVLPAKLRLNLEYLAVRSWRTDLKIVLLSAWYSLRPAAFDGARVRELFT